MVWALLGGRRQAATAWSDPHTAAMWQGWPAGLACRRRVQIYKALGGGGGGCNVHSLRDQGLGQATCLGLQGCTRMGDAQEWEKQWKGRRKGGERQGGGTSARVEGGGGGRVGSKEAGLVIPYIGVPDCNVSWRGIAHTHVCTCTAAHQAEQEPQQLALRTHTHTHTQTDEDGAPDLLAVFLGCSAQPIYRAPTLQPCACSGLR